MLEDSREQSFEQVKLQAYSPKQLNQLHSIMHDGDLKYDNSKDHLFDNWIIFMSMIVMVLILCFSIVIIQRHGIVTNDGALEVIENVRLNLDRKLIQDIEQLRINGACSAGFNRAVIEQWLGTVKKCLCEANGTVHDKCPDDASLQCRMGALQPEKSFYVWREEINFCIKDSEPIQMSAQATCPTGFKTPACFPNICAQEPCPLSKVEMAPLPAPHPPTANEMIHAQKEINHKQQIQNTKTMDIHHEQIVISNVIDIINNNNQKILFSTDSSKQPFNGITASTGSTLCWNYLLQPIPNRGKFYPLEKQAAKGCDQYGEMSQYVEKLDQMNMRTFYTKNSFAGTLDGLVYFKEARFYDEATSLFLLAERRIKVAPVQECLAIDTKHLSTISTGVSDFKDQIYLLSIITLCCTALLFVSLALFKAFNRGSFIIKGTDITVFIHGFGFLIGFGLVCFGIYYVYFTHKEGGLNETRKIIDVYLEKQCFPDLPVHNAFTSAKEYIESSFQLFHLPLTFLLGMGTIYLIGLIVLLCLKHNQTSCDDNTQE